MKLNCFGAIIDNFVSVIYYFLYHFAPKKTSIVWKIDRVKTALNSLFCRFCRFITFIIFPISEVSQFS